MQTNNKLFAGIVELLVAVAALVGTVVILYRLLDWILGTPKLDLQQVVSQEDREIECLRSEKAQLIEENAQLREEFHWWSLIKDFVARLAARLLTELCARVLVGCSRLPLGV